MAENQSYAEQNKARMKEITDSIETGIQELFQSDKYRQYLTTMSRFHRYSFNNTMLIYLQKPDATVCAGFNKWRDQFERNVKKGERGIKIIAPTPYKKKIEKEKLDPDTKLPMLDSDGKIITEEKEIKIPMYKPVTVFDVSQTEGKPLPELATNLTGNVQNYEVFMEALHRSAPVPIAFAPLSPDMDGYFSLDNQRITIREGMSEVQTVCATVHEIAHSKLHNKELPEVKDQWKIVMVSEGGTTKDFSGGFDAEEEAITAAAEQDWKHVDDNGFEWSLEVDRDDSIAEFIKKSRNTEEVEAESISFAVCAYYGIDTGENSFGYIATWSRDKELSELKASLETISKTSSGLITDIDRHYAAIMKERGLDKEPEISEALYLIDDSVYLHIQECETGYDYTLAHKGSYIEIDGGQLDNPELSITAIRDEILALNNIVPDEIVRLPAEDAQSFMDAFEQVTQPVVVSTSDLDPVADIELPDKTVSLAYMHAYGYTDGDMLPLSKEKALNLYEQDSAIYLLYEDGTEAMAFDAEEIEAFDGMFGISREDWEQSREYLELAEGHELTDKEIENSFLNNPADAFAIYQLKRSDDTRDLRFEPLKRVTAVGLTVERDNYDLIYTESFTKFDGTRDRLEDLFDRFNNHRPEDFHGHSLSVSDIVALKQQGNVTYHYVDSFDFVLLPNFAKAENYLKNAEMAMEDDYGMIDGIINNGPKEPTVAELEQQAKSGTPISLMDLAAASRRERESERKEKKPSVLEQLKRYEATSTIKNTAPKSAEMEI